MASMARNSPWVLIKFFCLSQTDVHTTAQVVAMLNDFLKGWAFFRAGRSSAPAISSYMVSPTRPSGLEILEGHVGRLKCRFMSPTEHPGTINQSTACQKIFPVLLSPDEMNQMSRTVDMSLMFATTSYTMAAILSVRQ